MPYLLLGLAKGVLQRETSAFVHLLEDLLRPLGLRPPVVESVVKRVLPLDWYLGEHCDLQEDSRLQLDV